MVNSGIFKWWYFRKRTRRHTIKSLGQIEVIMPAKYNLLKPLWMTKVIPKRAGGMSFWDIKLERVNICHLGFCWFGLGWGSQRFFFYGDEQVDGFNVKQVGFSFVWFWDRDNCSYFPRCWKILLIISVKWLKIASGSLRM